MATQRTSGIDRLQGILNLIDSGSTVFTGKDITETTRNKVPQEGLDRLLASLLESNQGLATVSSGQKAAGLYDSTVNSLLVNDLISRSAGEVASRNTETTRTLSTPPSVSPLNALLGIGGTAAANKLLSPAVDKVSEAIFGGKSAIPDAAITAANNTADPIKALYDGGFLEGGATNATNTANATTAATTAASGNAGINAFAAGASIPDAAIAIANETADPILSLFEQGFLEGGTTAATTGVGAATTAATSAGAGSAATSAGASAGAGGFDILSGIKVGPGSIPIIGTGIKLLQGDVKGAAKVGAGGYVGSAIGSAILPGVGTAIGSALGSIIGGGGCFITTAMCNYLGKPDDCYELETLREFRDTYMQETPERLALVEQYYQEAPALVRKLAQLEQSFRDKVYAEIQIGVEKAVRFIESKEYQSAMTVYKQMFNDVREAVEFI